MASSNLDIRADVAQTLAALRADQEHGASWLAQQASAQALRVCVAGQTGTLTPPTAIGLLREFCRDLAGARSSMAPLVTTATLLAAAAWGDDAPAALAAAAGVAQDLQATWHDAPTQLAAQLRARLSRPERVVTLSRSAAVAHALLANADRVVAITVLESRPGAEGVAVARELAAANQSWQVRLMPDAACLLALADATCCVVGADALLPAGFAVNKTGTHPLALGAATINIPCYVVAESLKIAPAAWQWRGENFAPTLLVADPLPSVTVTAPAFERVPLALVTVLSEQGTLDAATIATRGQALDAGLARLTANG